MNIWSAYEPHLKTPQIYFHDQMLLPHVKKLLSLWDTFYTVSRIPDSFIESGRTVISNKSCRRLYSRVEQEQRGPDHQNLASQNSHAKGKGVIFLQAVHRNDSARTIRAASWCVGVIGVLHVAHLTCAESADRRRRISKDCSSFFAR